LLALIATFYTVGLQGEHILLPSWGDFGFKSQEVSLGEFEGPWVVNPHPVTRLSATIDSASLFSLPVLWPEGTQGTIGSLNPNHHLLFPGSFDPLHFGHEQMVRHAERMTGKRVVFTMNARHPDKGEIAPRELLRRAEQFRWRSPVLFTQDEPLFIDKARRFPGFGFLIGADVVLGLLNEKYYGSIEARDAVLQEFRQLGTRFYVVGREVDGAFRTLDDMVIPAEARDLFIPVSGRWDIASRSLRR
ncbi:MAG: adenylyltransferase/cytidyltransferase family protein, partial [bacterium]|nr:adenylyltransferase/cytidyltransferase family protein [bacterium]